MYFDKKHIFVNARFLTQQTTGVQRFAIEIAKELVKLNHEIKFVAPQTILHPELEKEFEVHTFGLLTSHLWEQIELPIFLKKIGNPLLINLCNTAPLFYKNQIVTIHDLAFKINPQWFSKIFSTFYNFLIPRIANSCKHILTVSKTSKEEIIRYLNIPDTKISIIYNGVKFNHLPSNETLVQDNYILAVSSIDPRKNLTFLIEAFIKWNYPNLKLLIVGGQKSTFSKQNFITHDNVVFLGFVSDEELINYYKYAKAFVYPSLYEGFGLPPLEALYFGTKVIVSDIPSLREICGDSVFQYIDPYNQLSLISAFEKLVSSDDISTSKSIDLSGYNWEVSANKLNKIISQFTK